MRFVIAAACAAILGPSVASAADVRHLAIEVPGAAAMTYAISIPGDYDPKKPSPLVLVLHPGGDRVPFYGSLFMRQIVEPALKNLGAIMVAPDCPASGWADPLSDRAVMALVQQTLDSYTVDRRRILVTGYSMGGRGTWFMASHHPELFTAAIPMAASTGTEPLDRLATMPTYVIHGRRDEVVPYAPAERTAAELKALGRDVQFEGLPGLTHFQMGPYMDALARAGRWVAERWSR